MERDEEAYRGGLSASKYHHGFVLCGGFRLKCLGHSNWNGVGFLPPLCECVCVHVPLSLLVSLSAFPLCLSVSHTRKIIIEFELKKLRVKSGLLTTTSHCLSKGVNWERVPGTVPVQIWAESKPFLTPTSFYYSRSETVERIKPTLQQSQSAIVAGWDRSGARGVLVTVWLSVFPDPEPRQTAAVMPPDPVFTAARSLSPRGSHLQPVRWW